MIPIHEHAALDEREVEFDMIRAQGAGGQNVNKVSSAVHMRFDVRASSLPEDIKAAVLASGDRRISKDGVVVIKAQVHRSQEKNRAEALERLVALLRQASRPVKPRKATRPTRASQQRRVQRKVTHGRVKQLRERVGEE
ncbi:alternative ribosome rescue aminoacyl-tRNA hydrolase ArfB [Achromobacter aloeverae]